MGALLAVLVAFPPDDLVVPPLLEVGLPPPCDDDTDCPYDGAPHCVDMECVQCATAKHCEEGWACRAGFCRDACEVARDCDGVDGADVCDPATGLCVQCLVEADCDRAEWCYDGICLADWCDPGDRFCDRGDIVECEADGGTTTTVQRCANGCDESGEEPVCAAPEPETDGGSTTGTTSTSSSTTGITTAPPETDDAATGTPENANDDGCGCRSGGSAAWLLLLIAPLLRLRDREALLKC